MRIVSANLNQRMWKARPRIQFESWLRHQAAVLVVAQEPFNQSRTERPPLNGYTLISTSPMISCWLAVNSPMPTVVEHDERWHEILLGNLSVHNVYLSPHSSKERENLLRSLNTSIAATRRCCSIVLGDFNLAPRPADGLFGEQPSKFTSAAERSALDQLLRSAGLVDVTCPPLNCEPEFTMERNQNGRKIRFRCDLALVSEALLDCVHISYDHSVREAGRGFTDHSAIVVDLKNRTVDSLPGKVAAEPVTSGFPVERPSTAILNAAAHKTAIRRREAADRP
jgi:exonuclease III